MKRENWAGYSIRFVERNGEWWAVAQDVCEALRLKQVTRAMRSLKNVQRYNVCDLTISKVTYAVQSSSAAGADLTIIQEVLLRLVRATLL